MSVKSMLYKPQPVAVVLCGCMMFGVAGHSSTRKAMKHPTKAPATKAAEVSADVRRAIQSAYDEQNAAFSRQDIDGYMAHRASGYVLIDEDGEGPGQDKLRKTFGMMFQGTKESSATTFILSASSEGSGVVVSTKEHTQMTVMRPGDRKVGHLVADNRNRDFWVKAPDGWQEKRSKQVSSTQTVNGKPLH